MRRENKAIHYWTQTQSSSSTLLVTVAEADAAARFPSRTASVSSSSCEQAVGTEFVLIEEPPVGLSLCDDETLLETIVSSHGCSSGYCSRQLAQVLIPVLNLGSGAD